MIGSILLPLIAPKLNFVKATKEITVEHLFTHTSGLYYLYKAPEPGTEHVLGVAYTQSYEEGEEKYDKFWNTLKVRWTILQMKNDCIYLIYLRYREIILVSPYSMSLEMPVSAPV